MSAPGRTVTPRVIVQLLVFVVLAPFLPLLISRRWDWWEAWVYAAIGILGFAASRALAARRHPDLLAERARGLRHDDAAPWDKRLAPLVGLGGALIPLVAGVEASIDSSPSFSPAVKLVALAALAAGYALASYALIENRFFSGMVRIQAERGHHVVSGGPYRWIRHPGYMGALVAYWATPFFLDSAWALVPALLLTIVLVIRTNLEDRTLQGQLAGYREYAERVHHRLIPLIW